jgi:hypothetical protein
MLVGEVLDPTSATMASLCENDVPSGRLSSKFLEKGIAYVKVSHQTLTSRTSNKSSLAR